MISNRGIYKYSSLFPVTLRHTLCGILPQFVLIALVPAMFAASPPASAWSGSPLANTGVTVAQEPSIVVTSPSGELFLAGGACAAPTLTLGNPSQQWSCVAKFTAAGKPVFSTKIGGAAVDAMVLDASGNVYVAGYAVSGFATTAGVYQPNPRSTPHQFLCKLSGADGHALFCTYVDVDAGQGGLAVDASGNAYLVGLGCGPLENCVEQVNSNGTALMYQTTLGLISAAPTGNIAVAVDANGNLYCLCAGLMEFSPTGKVIATLPLDGELTLALGVDPSGRPEALLQDQADRGTYRIRKYSAGLSSTVFDTAFRAGAGSVLALDIDSSGVADVFGGATAINLTQVNPTQACGPPASNVGLAWNAFLVRVSSSGDLLQSTYLPAFLTSLYGPPQTAITATASGATAVFWAQNTSVSTMTLAPASATVALGCIGNAASFAPMPLAPNEIVSAFGAGLGPATPIAAQPSAGLYPLQLGGVQITFDGIAAPLLYASNGQVNLITPSALSGKSTTQVCAVVNDAVANCFEMPVQPAAPGIFSSGKLYDGSIPYAVALNQDGTINSQQNPAASGSIVSLFVTGLGATTPAVPDGSVTPASPPSQNLSVYMNASVQTDPNEGFLPDGAAQVLYAGPAPLEVEGLGQINLIVPPAAPTQIVSFQFWVGDLSEQAYGSNAGLIWTK
jgi:uncharacterized protein (TIGR03437 family)